MIDVRAPVEFALGRLPGAVNLPIMNNEERAAVGLAYKQQGQEAAIQLGHQLVWGAVKEARIAAWRTFLGENPSAVFYCFRGGMRSQIARQWTAQAGVHRPLIVGGYKRSRQFLRQEIDDFAKARETLVIAGPTGSGKTSILNQAKFYPNVDLESLAGHRGSAFGGMSEPQPSQVDFENALAVRLMRLAQDQRPALVEDESRLIGQRVIPEIFFHRMRESRVILVEESLDIRVDNIFRDYVLDTVIGRGPEDGALALFARYKNSTQLISRKLGGLRTQEILNDITAAEQLYRQDPTDLDANKVWIAKLLEYYYDPIYTRGLEKRQPRLAFRGRAGEILEYLRVVC